MNRRITRRDFIHYSVQTLSLLGLSPILKGCTISDPKKDWSKVPAEEFDMKAFDRWYKSNKLYKGAIHLAQVAPICCGSYVAVGRWYRCNCLVHKLIRKPAFPKV